MGWNNCGLRHERGSLHLLPTAGSRLFLRPRLFPNFQPRPNSNSNNNTRPPRLGVLGLFNAAAEMTTNEETPLLHATTNKKQQRKGHGATTTTTTLAATKAKAGFGAWLRRVFNVERRILFAGFLITLAFSYTQVPCVESPFF